ncbi:chaperonin GroEL [Reticulomyxa filosa]|uniref:Chaperonin GroEL n=1 Tax=Reticulomyxa filosa TaxID=46433 RepID=X6LUK7_RETFI|nr:chaperonin GroEL [Reticulomyxa filosa]|eukprot:ETO04817.1 chaperonin GroEL [Reticulomyxa filosa]
MVILTGGQVVSEDLGQKIEDVQLDDLIVVDFRTQIEETDSAYEKEKLGERLGKLSSGVAVIRVGGSSEVEVNEKKDRINDALNATRAAVDQGVVIGGGIALLYSTKILDSVEFDNEDQRVGIDIVRKAIQLPAIAIIRNSGKEGNSRYGYGCAIDQWCDLHKLGVIDPFKVVCTVLQDAVSVASLMTELPKKDTPKMDMGGAGAF